MGFSSTLRITTFCMCSCSTLIRGAPIPLVTWTHVVLCASLACSQRLPPLRFLSSLFSSLRFRCSLAMGDFWSMVIESVPPRILCPLGRRAEPCWCVKYHFIIASLISISTDLTPSSIICYTVPFYHQS